MRLSLRIYRLLLRLYPAGFRENYTAPLQRQFRDDYSDVRGWSDRVRFWSRTLLDFVQSWPEQFGREIVQDAKHAVRVWRRRPLHTLFAVVALAVGIGANTGVFSVLNALLLRSLPFHEPERLAALHLFGAPNSPAEFHDWYSRSAYLSDAASFLSFDVNGEASGAGARMRLSETSSNFFSMLGVRPALGRAFATDEDIPGRGAVAVIGYGLWHRQFGGDRTVVGSPIRINGISLTVIGVAPPGFDYPGKTEVWSPTRFDLLRIPKTASALFPTTIGRLKPDLTWAQARQAYEAEVFQQEPGGRSDEAANRPALVPLREQLAGPVKQASLMLMGGVVLLLLLACANVANLLLARTVSRSNELVIRTALGASRARLTQQMLTETLLLAVMATAVGMIVAIWVAGVASSVQPAMMSTQAYTVLDWRVLAFALLIGAGTGLTFGVGPALYVARFDPSALNRTTTGGYRHARARNVLIAAQIATTIILLTGSMALGRAFMGLLWTNNGYELDSVATLKVSLAGTGNEQTQRASSYYDQVFTRLQGLPLVISASATESLPLSVEGGMATRFTVDRTGEPTLAPIIPVAPGYFRTIGTEVLFGREFGPDDLTSPELRVVVTEEFARRFGSPSAAVGRSITAGTWPSRRIVGVVRGIRYAGPMFEPGPLVFWLSRSPRASTVVVRVNGSARSQIAAIRDTVQSVDPKVPVFDVMTMDERLSVALARPKFYTTAVLFFGGLALLLAVIGVYGILSYSVAQRTREMGIRLALGTTPARLRASVLRQTSVIVAVGATIGILASTGAARFLDGLVHGADAGMFSSSAVAIAVTIAVAASTIWLATRHINRLDIADVLRAEAAD